RDQEAMDGVAKDGEDRPGQYDRDEGTERVPKRRLNAERREQIERGVHAEHHEIAMGEIDDAHHAEDQAEPDAHQAIDRADEETAGPCLQEAFEELRHWRPRSTIFALRMIPRAKPEGMLLRQCGPMSCASRASERLPTPQGLSRLT